MDNINGDTSLGGIIEDRGLFHDPKINLGGWDNSESTTVLEVSNTVANVDWSFTDFFDVIFYFIYMLLRIPLDLIGWIFGFNTSGGFSEFFNSLLSGNGLLGYLGYFLDGAPFSKLFGTGVGKIGGYSLIPDGTWNPFTIIGNFFSNPFGGPSFFELFFGGISLLWWALSFLLVWFLFFWRKKISKLDEEAAEKYDNIEEYVDIEMFHDDNKRKRWIEILKLIENDDIYDWRESIFLADILLNDVFESHDLHGSLKEIFSKIDMKSSDNVIKVKDFAKEIKHISDEDLTKKMVKESLDDYSTIFKELYFM